MNHPDVADVCVVGVADDFSMLSVVSVSSNIGVTGGELPMAFIVLSSKGLQKVKNTASAQEEIKESVIKVLDILQ